MRSPSVRFTAALSLGALLALGLVDAGTLSTASAAESLPSISITDATGASGGARADLGASGDGKYTVTTDLVCPVDAPHYELVISEYVKTKPDTFFTNINIANYLYSTYAEKTVEGNGTIAPVVGQFPGAAGTWWAGSLGDSIDLSTVKPGIYSFGVTCTIAGSGIWFDPETNLAAQAWTALKITDTAWSVPAVVAPAVTTSTTIGATKSATDDTAADLVATVLAASGSAAGTVQFFDGATPVGSPVALSNTGGASITAPGLAGGEHSFTAVFTATDSGLFAASTSVPALLTIVSSTKAQTSVTLTGSASGTDANLLATVSSAEKPVTTAAGRVEFADEKGDKVSDAAVNALGVATTTISGLTPGESYLYTAVYVATASENFVTSAASSVLTVDVARADETPLLIAGGVVVPDQKYRVVAPAETFVAGETVSGEIRSTPITLTETTTAAADGSAEYVFTAPKELVAGSSHELVLTGAAGAEYSVAFTVKAADSTVVPVSSVKPGANSPVGFATDWVGAAAQSPQGIAGLFAGLLGLAALLVGGVAWVNIRRRRAEHTAK